MSSDQHAQARHDLTAEPVSRPFLLMAVLVIVALILNISGAVISRYIATSFDTRIMLAALLLALLACNHLVRVFFWVAAGRVFQLSFIYPVLSINYFFSFMLGIFVFGEAFSWRRLLGSLIIVGGVAIIATSKARLETTAGPP